jgi:hypothetical protein
MKIFNDVPISLKIRETTYEHPILSLFFILHKCTFFNKWVFNMCVDMDKIILAQDRGH